MKNSKWIFGALMAVSLTAPTGFADVLSDQLRFRQLFLDEVRAQNPTATADQVEALHSVADPAIEKMLKASSIAEAMGLLSQTSMVNLVNGTKPYSTQKIAGAAPSPLSGLTIVLVPGVFAEFIQNRAFEEVFEKKDSKFRDEFKRLVAEKGVKDSVSLLENYRPGRPTGEVAGNESRRLDQVINVGDMEIKGIQVKVILFFTEFSTLESLGVDQERAEIFNRRLEKYLNLTGEQNLAFVGYSRGTPLALEMLAQAKTAGRPWIKDVKAMISLSGVVWGSSLADSAYYDKLAPANKIITDLQETVASLVMIDESKSILSPRNVPTVASNTGKWLMFVKRALLNYRAMDADKSTTNAVSATKSLMQTDPRTPLAIVLQVWEKLGLTHPVRDYNKNIVRFQYFVNQLLASIQGLSTHARTAWWTSHDIPLNPIYYAIPAAMANPDANATELALFNNPLSYGGKDNYDDASLLLNSLDYAKITRATTGGGGVSLNDSQVAVAQSAFLTNVIAALRPANAGVKTKFLGIAGTHHWGMALRVVNKNRVASGGGKNGFPREALLRALATEVLLDYP